jgi:hypothetical protein
MTMTTAGQSAFAAEGSARLAWSRQAGHPASAGGVAQGTLPWW